MGTSAISSLSTSDITALQDDVNELNTKLNALIIEFNKCSDDTTTNKGKIDTLITDMTAIQARVSGSYSPSHSGGSNAGSASDSILLRLERLDDDFTSLGSTVLAHITNYAGRTSSDPLNSLTEVSTSAAGSGDDTSVNATSSSVTGSYGAAETKVITIGAKGEVRARKLARQTLNRLRK